MRSFERPFQPFIMPDGHTVHRPVLDVVFEGLEAPQPMLLDTGADLSVAPRAVAENIGLQWQEGTPMTMRGLSRKPGCLVRGRILDAGLLIVPGGWRLRVPVFFADENVPLLAGHRGFLDRLHVTLHGPRRIVRIALP